MGMYKTLHKANERKRKAAEALDNDEGDFEDEAVLPEDLFSDSSSSASGADDDESENEESQSQEDSDSDDEEDTGASKVPDCHTAKHSPIHLNKLTNQPVCLLCPQKRIMRNDPRTIDEHLKSKAHVRRAKRFIQTVEKMSDGPTAKKLPKDPRTLVAALDDQVVGTIEEQQDKEKVRRKTNVKNAQRLLKRLAHKQHNLDAKRGRRQEKRARRLSQKQQRQEAMAVETSKTGSAAGIDASKPVSVTSSKTTKSKKPTATEQKITNKHSTRTVKFKDPIKPNSGDSTAKKAKYDKKSKSDVTESRLKKRPKINT